MSRHRWLWGCALLLIGSVGAVALAFLIVSLAMTGDDFSMAGLGGRVGLVELVGDIDQSGDVVDQLLRMERDPTVKAVVFRLDSPGGGVAASQEIHAAVLRVREEGKPVVVSMGGVAASGALYVACAADSVVANAGTLTGSIGVVMSFPNTEELFRKVGVRFETVKTGKFKDTGSMWRPMTDEERALLQGVLANVYDQFINVIVEGRGLERDEILPIADGRIFSGDQAASYGFVDRLGGLEDAIAMAAGMAGIEGRPSIVRKVRRRVSVFDFLEEKMNPVARLVGSGPRLEYRLR